MSSAREFCQEWKRVRVGAASRVSSELADQRLSSSNYIIIDHAEYQSLLARAGKLFAHRAEFRETDRRALQQYSPKSLNLCYTQLAKVSQLAACLSNADITSVSLLAPTRDEINLVRAQFPNLKTVTIKFSSYPWLKKNLTALNGLEVELNDTNEDYNKVIRLPHQLDVRSLTIKARYLRLEIPSGVRAERLRVEGSSVCLVGDTAHIENLQEMIVANSNNPKMVVNPNLPKLTLENNQIYGSEAIPLHFFNSLKELTLKKTSLVAVTLN